VFIVYLMLVVYDLLCLSSIIYRILDEAHVAYRTLNCFANPSTFPIVIIYTEYRITLDLRRLMILFVRFSTLVRLRCVSC